jgi:hypothetical protein
MVVVEGGEARRETQDESKKGGETAGETRIDKTP